jgi:hypothetical protein
MDHHFLGRQQRFFSHLGILRFDHLHQLGLSRFLIAQLIQNSRFFKKKDLHSGEWTEPAKFPKIKASHRLGLWVQAV